MKNQNEKLGQESAFPIGYDTGYDASKGMSKRFYTACMAMQGLCSNPHVIKCGELDLTPFIETAYKMADELLKQENI